MIASVMPGRGDNPSNPARQRSVVDDFAISNSTSHHFLGASQRPWMNAGHPRQPTSALSAKAVRKNTVKNVEPTATTTLSAPEQSNVNTHTEDHLVRQSNEQQHQPGQVQQPAQPEFSGSTQNGSLSATADTGLAGGQTSAPQSTALPETSTSSPADVQCLDYLVFSQTDQATTSPTTQVSTLSMTKHGKDSLQKKPPHEGLECNTPVCEGEWQSFNVSEPLRFSTSQGRSSGAVATPAFSSSTPLTTQAHPLPAADPTPADQIANPLNQSQSLPVESPVSVHGSLVATKRPSEVATDMTSKRVRSAATQVHQIPTPRSTPTRQNVYVKHLLVYVDRVRQHMTLSAKDEQRLTLLLQACGAEDIFYLVLHQIYCLASYQPQSVTRLGFGAAEKAGLAAIEPILIPNTNLSANLVELFATYPRAPEALCELAIAGTVERVKEFLIAMGTTWDQVRRICFSRQSPPCCEEIVHYFALRSTLMQRTLFNSLMRQVSRINDQGFQSWAIQLFERSQDRHQQQAAQPGYRIDKILPGVVQAFDYEYRSRLLAQISTHQRSHRASSCSTQPPSHLSLPSPQGNPSGIALNSVTNGHSQCFGLNYSRGLSVAEQVVQPSPTMLTHGQIQLQPNTAQLRRPSAARAPAQVQSDGTISSVTQPNNALLSSLNNQTQAPAYDPRIQYFIPHQAQLRSQSWETQSSQAGASLQQPITQRTSSLSSQNSQIHAQAPTTARASTAQLSSEAVIPQQYLQSAPQGVSPSAPAGLLPPPGYTLPQTTHPVSDRIALHQFHLHSPSFIKIHGDGTEAPNERFYAYPAAFALSPQRFDHRDKFLTRSFDIPQAIFAAKASRQTLPKAAEASGCRIYKSGCNIFRLKCGRRAANLDSPDAGEFAEMAICWPSCAFISLNGVQDIEMRRKPHWGRDLAIDITDIVQEGANTLAVSYHSIPSEQSQAFYFAVEIVQVTDHGSTCCLAQSINAEEAMSAIVAPLDMAQDAEISFRDPSLSIDLIDPFMSKVWTIPVRGNHCKHRECFDLESFLLSRTTRQNGGPTDPDRWNCPICKKDARPQVLLIDQFLIGVRQSLEAGQKLHAKAILVKQDGTWEAKL